MSRKWPQRKEKWLKALANTEIRTLYASPKLDGVRCTATVDSLFTKCGSKIHGLDHIQVDATLLLQRQLKPYGKGKIILDGELYMKNTDDVQPTLGEMLGNVGKRNPKIDFRMLKYEPQISLYLFDAYFTEHPTMPYSTRFKELSRLYRTNKPQDNITNIFLLPRKNVRSEQDCEDYLEKSVAKGYEGIVVRTGTGIYYPGQRSSHTLKYLYSRFETCTIVDVIEGKGYLKDAVGSVLCETSTKKLHYVNFSLGFDQRKFWWERREKLRGRSVVVKTFTRADGDIRFGSVVRILGTNTIQDESPSVEIPKRDFLRHEYSREMLLRLAWIPFL